MSGSPQRLDDQTFAIAWQAFVEADCQCAPPAALDARVMDAVLFNRMSPVRRRRSVPLAALGVAASVAIAVALSGRGSFRPPVAPDATVTIDVPAAPDRASAVSPHLSHQVPAHRRPAVAPERVGGQAPNHKRLELPAVVMPFGAGPVHDTEPLQLVRLRIPRQALRALGLVLLEPDAPGLVDVDVLIGEDGLPRDIRKIHLEQE